MPAAALLIGRHFSSGTPEGFFVFPEGSSID
jgi:hypothetical protein